jgi:hypothetical protein
MLVFPASLFSHMLLSPASLFSHTPVFPASLFSYMLVSPPLYLATRYGSQVSLTEFHI